MRGLRAGVFAAFAAAAWAPGAAATETEATAGALAREIRGIRAQLVETAAAVQAREGEAAAAAADLAGLEERYAARLAEWEARRTDLAAALAGLTRAARRPRGALLSPPADWANEARASALLERAIPLLAARADRAAAEAEELARLGAALARRRDAAVAARAALTRERAGLERLLERKSALWSAAGSGDRARADARAERAALAAGAASVSGLMERIAAGPPPPRPARPAPGPPPPAPARRPGSSLPWPAHGEIVAAFGEDAGGERRLGVSIGAPGGARVVAPDDGEIVFAGPFRSYGLLLIIEHEGGYHSLLAGFARIDGEVGQRVLAGEPVGVMAAGGGAASVLYVEVRRDGRPVDPAPWLLSDNRKVNG